MYRNIIAILFVMLSLLAPLRSTAWACGEIIPPQEVVDIVTPQVYSDFPKLADVLAIMKIESSFNPKARNPNKREPGTSNGIMQVNGGPFEMHLNIQRGIEILREYYEITKSKEGAVKAYNIGIGNYLRGYKLVSAEEYYSKFKLARRIYENYPKAVKYLGNSLGCSPTAAKWDAFLGRPAGSNLLLPYEGAGRGNHPRRKVQSNKDQPA